MREIKFRAWDKEIKKMYEVIKIDFYNEKVGYLFADPITQGEAIGYFKFSDIDLMQYTGLKDKHGKEIYEGDIVKITGDYKPGTYTVIWDDYRVAWWLKNIKQRELEYEDDYYQLLGDGWQPEYRLVIGNVFEDGDLLNDSE